MQVHRLCLCLLLATACAPTPETPAAEPATTPDAPTPTEIDAAAVARGRAAMKTLGLTLKDTLISTMKAEGPVAALHVCSGQAQGMTTSVSDKTGVTVGRSSLRLRNPKNAGPPWVRDWLKAQGERPAEGVEPQVSTARGPGGRPVVRVVAPLPVEAPCLVCHGAPTARPDALNEAIAERYPQDQAHGYTLGALRGAIWAEVEVVASGVEP